LAVVRAPTSSPISWLCDFSREKGKKTSGNKLTSTLKSVDSKDRSQDYRKNAAASYFQESDEELNSFSPIPAGKQMSNVLNGGSLVMKQQAFSRQGTTISHQQATVQGPVPFLPSESTSVRPIQGEARIVAPNVSKLSPQSAVEIRLHSSHESVAVLCAVDVLKMRSSFFHDLLLEQEKNAAMATVEHSIVHMINNGNVMWRDPIVIPEASPFEAAAFLESLHEGRALFRGEWNICWARLRYIVFTHPTLST
jgi:hypothetical protein